MGVNSLGVPRSTAPGSQLHDDDYGEKKDKGLYTTFSSQDNEMPVSIGGTTTLAKIDTGSDFYVILKRFLESLPVFIQK